MSQTKKNYILCKRDVDINHRNRFVIFEKIALLVVAISMTSYLL